MTTEELKIKELAEEINDALKFSVFKQIKGAIFVEKSVGRSVSANFYLETKDGKIYHQIDWDIPLGEDSFFKVKNILHAWLVDMQVSYLEKEEDSFYVSEIKIDNASVEVTSFKKETKMVNDFERLQEWVRNSLPVSPEPCDIFRKKGEPSKKTIEQSLTQLTSIDVANKKEQESDTMNYEKIENLMPELSRKIKSFLPFEVQEHYVYVQWNNQKDEVQCEVGVFLKNDLDEVFHIDLLERHGCNRGDIIEFTFELEDTVHEFMKQYGKVEYVEFAYSSGIQNQLVVLLLEFDLNSPLDYPKKQKKWLKEMFNESVKLPIHYKIDSILSEPNQQYKSKMSKNFLIRNGASIHHSRFLGNHVKVLNNKEIKVYAKLLKRVFNQKLEPFLMVNNGNIFVYSKKENQIYIYFPSDQYCMELMKATPVNIKYLVEGYFAELSRIKLIFNSDLLEKPLKENEILYTPSFSNGDESSYIPGEMENSVELLASGM